MSRRSIRNKMALNEKYHGSRINPPRPHHISLRVALSKRFCIYFVMSFGISEGDSRVVVDENDKIARVEHVITSRFTWLKNLARGITEPGKIASLYISAGWNSIFTIIRVKNTHEISIGIISALKAFCARIYVPALIIGALPLKCGNNVYTGIFRNHFYLQAICLKYSSIHYFKGSGSSITPTNTLYI